MNQEKKLVRARWKRKSKKAKAQATITSTPEQVPASAIPVSIVGEHIKDASERITDLELKLKHGEIDEDAVIQILVRIENARIMVVDEIWNVIGSLLTKIKEGIASTQDIQKLGTVLGILVDKAQLIQGRPTMNLGIQKKDAQALPLSSRLNAYRGLMRAKPGRPTGGGGPEEKEETK